MASRHPEHGFSERLTLGWPDKRGLFDAAGFTGEVREAGMEDIPAFLEIIYPFELADETKHCRQGYCGERLGRRRAHKPKR